jgi:D-3-phosphoglycerate dehydrogenase
MRRVAVVEAENGQVVVAIEAFGGLDVEFTRSRCASEEDVVRAVRDADVVVAGPVEISRLAMAGMRPGSTVIMYGAGYDKVDLVAARSLGVRVATIPDYGVETVADHAAALLLGLLRKIHPYDRLVRERGWVGADLVGQIASFGETTVGLVGTGRIGTALARRLVPFGFTVLAVDPYAVEDDLAHAGLERVAFADLLARSDAVSLHAPLTSETRHLLDRDAFRLMRPGTVIVNTSRGALIDEVALVEALRDGRVGGAGLDVFAEEPLSVSSPLREFEQVILTPHAGYYSTGSVAKLQKIAGEQVRRALTGEHLRNAIAE